MKFKNLEGHYSFNQILNVKTGQVISFNDMIDDLSSERIIFIGETHENRYHHEIQLKVLKALYEKNRNIFIGMEMFQRPFQQVLDEYISGRMEEETFLKRSEYFKRWKFDYNLYKTIIDFAKEKGLRIIALNIPKEIIDKISAEGIGALTEDERKEVSEIGTYEDTHRTFLRKVFEEHHLPEERFEFFYQAQLAWDQSMAFSIAEFFKNAGAIHESPLQMVVIAGTGHSLRFGIPERVIRLMGDIKMKILIPESLYEATGYIIEKDLADYIWFTP